MLISAADDLKLSGHDMRADAFASALTITTVMPDISLKSSISYTHLVQFYVVFVRE